MWCFSFQVFEWHLCSAGVEWLMEESCSNSTPFSGNWLCLSASPPGATFAAKQWQKMLGTALHFSSIDSNSGVCLNQSPKHQSLFILSSVLSHNQFTCWHRDRLDTRPFHPVYCWVIPLYQQAEVCMFLGRTSPVILCKYGLGSSGPALRVIHAEKVL